MSGPTKLQKSTSAFRIKREEGFVYLAERNVVALSAWRGEREREESVQALGDMVVSRSKGGGGERGRTPRHTHT